MQLAEQNNLLVGQQFFLKKLTNFEGCGVSSVIGSEGGVITVENPYSHLFGTSLRIPTGALDTPVRISISPGEHISEFGWSPSIRLLPAGLQFKKPATLKICLDDRWDMAMDDVKTAEPAVYYYDESINQWTFDCTVKLERHGNMVLYDLYHL